jgi:hypothetical protein
MHNTQRETLVFNSIKRYLVDELHRGQNVKTFFGFLEELPRGIKEHVIVTLDDFETGNVCTATMNIYMYVRKNTNGELSALAEKVLSLFVVSETEDVDAVSGVKSIPLVDETGTAFSQMKAYPKAVSSVQLSLDFLFFRHLPVTLLWGGR